jgi:Outer membrane protein beta-barrel domain
VPASRRRLAAWATVATLVATVAYAQAPEPLRGAVADLRLLSTTLPSGLGWTPSLSTNALVPGRGFGVDAGVHAFVWKGRRRRVSIGATGLVAQGRATGIDAPTVTTRMFAAAPHLAWAFGHRDGWSYLSVGAGAASVRSDADGQSSSPTTWGLAYHYGVGARWFVREHVAVSLDLRFWALTPRAATADRPSAPANTRIAIGAGLSLR